MNDEQPKPIEHHQYAEIGKDGGTYLGTDEDGEPTTERDTWFGGVVVVGLPHLDHLNSYRPKADDAGGNDV